MSNDEKELLEKYRRLIWANKTNALSNIRVALASQENTLKQYGIPDREPEATQPQGAA